MTYFGAPLCVTLALAAASSAALALPPSSTPVPVTVNNYNRAQTDAYLGQTVKAGALGTFRHGRELAPIVNRGIVRPNRDTLYSFAVFDFDAGPVTITLPDGGQRFMVMQVVNEDQYTPAVFYGAGKHTLTRAGSGEFVANLATHDLRGPMNETSAPFARGDNEFARAGLTMAECRLVAAPRVAESPAALECKVVEIRSVSGAGSGSALTLGEVVAFHIDERFLLDGRFDTARAHPLARCGYQDYTAVEKVFAMARPKGGGDI